jgi:hypothetical protein
VSERTALVIAAAVCNYNGREHLPHCLAALAAQSLPPSEIWLFDNASTDGSVAWVREHHPRVKVVELGANRGPCPARNAALERLESEWVLLLDNDAVLEPEALAELAACAARHPSAALVQPRSVFFDEPDRVHYDGGDFHYCGLFALRHFGARLADLGPAEQREVAGAVAVALLARRAVLLELGGFDAGYFILFEDLDLSYRLSLVGQRIFSAERALCRHRGGTGGISFRSGSYPLRRSALHSRNRWRFLLKCLRARTLLVAAPGLVLYELADFGFAARSGNLVGWIQGKVQLARSLGEILRARRAVQRDRSARDRDLLVGGPLTPHPKLRGRASRALSALLACWWKLTRPLAG